MNEEPSAANDGPSKRSPVFRAAACLAALVYPAARALGYYRPSGPPAALPLALFFACVLLGAAILSVPRSAGGGKDPGAAGNRPAGCGQEGDCGRPQKNAPHDDGATGQEAHMPWTSAGS